jgi:hypothetical protein
VVSSAIFIFFISQKNLLELVAQPYLVHPCGFQFQYAQLVSADFHTLSACITSE